MEEEASDLIEIRNELGNMAFQEKKRKKRKLKKVQHRHMLKKTTQYNFKFVIFTKLVIKLFLGLISKIG